MAKPDNSYNNVEDESFNIILVCPKHNKNISINQNNRTKAYQTWWFDSKSK